MTEDSTNIRDTLCYKDVSIEEKGPTVLLLSADSALQDAACPVPSS